MLLTVHRGHSSAFSATVPVILIDVIYRLRAGIIGTIFPFIRGLRSLSIGHAQFLQTEVAQLQSFES